jgi:hypothetical protein
MSDGRAARISGRIASPMTVNDLLAVTSAPDEAAAYARQLESLLGRRATGDEIRALGRKLGAIASELAALAHAADQLAEAEKRGGPP